MFKLLLHFIAAFVCPDLQEEYFIQDGIDEGYIVVNGSEEVDPENVLTSVGIHLRADDSIGFPISRPDRIMDMEFKTTGAQTVNVTFHIPNGGTFVIEVCALARIRLRFKLEEYLCFNVKAIKH